MSHGLDPGSDRAVYKQIADSIRHSIDSGALAPGQKVPSESQLMAEFGVAQGTVRQALSLLRSQGLVVAEHGRGVFVRTKPKIRRLAHDRFARSHREAGKAAYLADAERMGIEPSVDVYFVGPEKADATVAALLGIRSGTKVLVRRRRYFADDHPTELATSYIPWKIAAGTEMTHVDTGPGGIYARLEEAGHNLGRFTEEVTARMPTEAEVRSLQLASGTPVLSLMRVAYDTQDRPVEICDTVMASDRYLLSYELPG